jgi:hypothetical protein
VPRPAQPDGARPSSVASVGWPEKKDVRIRTIVTVAAIILVAVTAACAAPSAASRPPRGTAGNQSPAGTTDLPGLGRGVPKANPPIGPAPIVGSFGDVRLPLDAYAVTRDQLEQLETAENLAAHVCLRRLGLPLPEQTFSPLVTAAEVPRYKLHFLTFAMAKRSGYGHVGILPPDLHVVAPPGISPAELAAAGAAFYGETARVNGRRVPEGGCEGWARRAILSPSQPVDPLNMIYQSEDYVLNDARMLELFAAWRSCMTARGFSLPTPLVAQQGPAAGAGWPAEPDALEITVATADARCRQQVNMEGMWVALMTAYEKEYVGMDLPQLIQAQKVSDEWLRHAAAYGA